MKVRIIGRRVSIGVLILYVTGIGAHVREVGAQEVARSGEVRLLAGEKGLWHVPEAGASWQRLAVPSQEGIDCLTTDPHGRRRVLLCQGGALWRSENGGQSWDLPIFKSVQEQAVAAAFHPKLPNKLFLVTNRRLLISTNGGKDWMPATPGLRFTWRPRMILVSSKQPDRMYVMTGGDGAYRSDDGGQAWTAINSGLPKAIGAAPVAPIESAVLNPTNPDVAYIAAEARGVYKTTNGGRTWVGANRGLPDLIMYRTSPWVLEIDPANPQRLLVWASWPVHSDRVDSAFFLSEDGAASWRVIAPGADHSRVFALQFVDPQVGLAVAVTEDGVMVLSN